MEVKQIKEIIEKGETEEVEFKESFHSSQDIAKAICAFANTNGGVLLLGISSKKQVIGLKGDMDKLQQRISACLQTIHPMPTSSIKLHQLEGKKIIVIIIQKSDVSTFYSFSGSIYVRLGCTNRRLEAPEMVDFLQAKNVLCFDEIISGAKISDIDIKKVEDYLNKRNQKNYLTSHSIEEFLLNSKLAKMNSELLIKNSAILLFGIEPIKIFPQLELKLVKFEGTEAVKILAHQLVESVLQEQIESAISFVKKNISKEIRIGKESKREEIFEYPSDVIRESIVNAIVHRDYFNKDSVQINIFNDRIEIISPGGLPTGLTKELLGTLSVQRNPITYRFLRDYEYVEGLGTGIPRMRNSMRNHGLADPIFDVSPNFFRVILKNKKAGLKPIETIKDLNDRQKNALIYLLEHKSIKAQTYAKINSVSHATAVHEINEMIKFKYLDKVGAYRGAYYILNEEKIKNK